MAWPRIALLLALLLALLAGVPTAARAGNVALAALGARVVDASSVHAAAPPGGAAIMWANLLTETPTAWLWNGETRTIFAAGDQAQSITLDLGRDYRLSSVGVSYAAGDRPLVGPLLVYGAPAALPGGYGLLGGPVPVSAAQPLPGFDTLLSAGIASPAAVRFLRLLLGPTSTEYNSDGSAISRIFAEVLPEGPVAVAMSEASPAALLGAGLVGLGLMRRRRRWAAHSGS